ncbi:DUF924 family protein [Noviherbaspirillum saxi]|uniref:DUF924 family protein n=1 Tax=Noviherbaspirillum saxi TaxID=2320863 RepID=UPI001F433B70|nr:DUF924 family protein [Noviherbaspirillum saxi]
MDINAVTIIDFWFGSEQDDRAVADRQAALWWSKNTALDADMRERFAGATRDAAAHALDDWADTSAGLLALILLTDQFPRNMYRDTPQSFAFDELARDWCKQGLHQGMHATLRPIERVFFYLPLEHSESLADQDLAVSLFSELAAKALPLHRTAFDGFYGFAIRHREVIRRFGRFPHRNHILGRDSTPEEIAFLQEKGSSF